MKISSFVKVPPVALSAVTLMVLLMLSGCIAPIEAPAGAAVDASATESPAPETAPEMATVTAVQSITLPDGTECLNAGEGATLAFDGARVNYTCGTVDEGDIVLLGELVSPRLDLLDVTQGLVTHGDDGFSLAESEVVSMRMSEVTLADGTICLNAGQGATMAFDDKRVNYTCGESDAGSIVLLGDFMADMTTVTVEQGVIVQGSDGMELAESQAVAVSAIVGEALE